MSSKSEKNQRAHHRDSREVPFDMTADRVFHATEDFGIPLPPGTFDTVPRFGQLVIRARERGLNPAAVIAATMERVDALTPSLAVELDGETADEVEPTGDTGIFDEGEFRADTDSVMSERVGT
jgi:hypothetical protein